MNFYSLFNSTRLGKQSHDDLKSCLNPRDMKRRSACSLSRSRCCQKILCRQPGGCPFVYKRPSQQRTPLRTALKPPPAQTQPQNFDGPAAGLRFGAAWRLPPRPQVNQSRACRTGDSKFACSIRNQQCTAAAINSGCAAPRCRCGMRLADENHALTVSAGFAALSLSGRVRSWPIVQVNM